MARCGACAGRANAQNSLRRPAVIGDENGTISRVRVAAHGGSAHPAGLQVGSTYFVSGVGVDPLIEAGVLTLT